MPIDSVYVPCHDTWLLTDTIKEEVKKSPDSFRDKVWLEIGSGSGYISHHVHEELRNMDIPSYGLCLDFNHEAAKMTQHQNPRCDIIVTDMYNGIRQDVLDVLFFNPPYVETTEEEFLAAVEAKDLNAACAGGPEGSVILDRFLTATAELQPKSVIFVVVEHCNDFEGMRTKMKKLNWKFIPLKSVKRGPHEFLVTFKGYRKQTTRDPPRTDIRKIDRLREL